MKITVNGREEVLGKGVTLAELVDSKGLNPDTVIVEYNQDIVMKETWAGITLQEDDRLEILRFVGGG